MTIGVVFGLDLALLLGISSPTTCRSSSSIPEPSRPHFLPGASLLVSCNVGAVQNAAELKPKSEVAMTAKNDSFIVTACFWKIERLEC